MKDDDNNKGLQDSLGDRTVLVIDDSEAVRTALDVLLSMHGARVIGADTAEAGIDALAREPVDLVVQDMNFRREATSGEEGVALFRAIKKLDADLPVVLLTAWSSLETAVSLVLVRAGENSSALLPDSLEGSREIVVKTLGPHIASVAGVDVVFAASTDLGSFSGLRQGEPLYEQMVTEIATAVHAAGRYLGGPQNWMDRDGFAFFQGPPDTALLGLGVRESLRTAVRGPAPVEGQD